MESVALATASTRPARRAAGRGLHPKDRAMRQKPRGKGSLPEYLEAAEVEDLIRQAPHAAARLMMLIQWRAGLRISEALALEARDLQLDTDRPTLRVRRGKGERTRVVPVHPELEAALRLWLGLWRDRRVKPVEERVNDIPIPVVLFIDLFVDHFSPPNLPNYTCRDKDVCREHKTADII